MPKKSPKIITNASPNTCPKKYFTNIYKQNIPKYFMRSKISNFFVGGHHFQKEFRKQIRLLLTFTFGFTIAFTWRQTIFDTTQSIINFFIHLQSTTASSILTSTIITLVSLLILYFSAHFLKERSSY